VDVDRHFRSIRIPASDDSSGFPEGPDQVKEVEGPVGQQQLIHGYMSYSRPRTKLEDLRSGDLPPRLLFLSL
jgi:hypothetical protein